MSAINANETLPPPAMLVHTHIAPTTGWVNLKFRELWEYRELVFFFVWRDLKVRYKQTIVGAGWAVIQPIFSMVVFTIIFGNLAKLDSDGVPYAIFSFTALVPWSFFVATLTGTAGSMLSNAGMIKKIYFPRLTIPLSEILSSSVDFGIQFVVLVVLMLVFKITPTLNVLWLPLFVLLAVVTALGVGLWLATWNFRFRDIKYIQGFLIQSWFFITPIVYSTSLLDEPWKTLYGLNPMAGVVEGFRWALLGTSNAPSGMIGYSALAALVILISGLYQFRRLERTFADVI